MGHGLVSKIIRSGKGETTYTVIRELEAEDVRHIENGLVLRIIGFGSGNVCLDTVDLLIRPWCWLKCEKDKIRISELPSGVPS